MLRVSGSIRDDVVSELRNAEGSATGLSLSALRDRVDTDLAKAIFTFCEGCFEGISLDLSHQDLSSGTDREQQIWQLRAETVILEKEKTVNEKKKKDSGSEKDFAVAASKKREAVAEIERCTRRLAEIADMMGVLEGQVKEMPWWLLCLRWEACSVNTISRLDLSDCCLHATAIKQLASTLLELEQRGDGTKVTELTLDGNNLGDIGMAPLTELLRLTTHLEALRVRNVGITESGLSELVAGLVTNKSLLLLDVRSNGLCSQDVGIMALSGVKHFNKKVEIWFP